MYYDIQGGLTFPKAPWMADFFADAFERKADAKRVGAGLENYSQLRLRVLGV